MKLAQVELVQTDYSKKFVLATDAPDVAIVAALTQDNKLLSYQIK